MKAHPRFKIAVVYLWRESQSAEAFLESYRQHDAGLAHVLVLVLKGRCAALPEPETGVFGGHRPPLQGQVVSFRVADFGFDLRAYRVAARRLAGFEFICCLNSHTRVTAAGWLADLHALAAQAFVGMAGAFGSRESFYQNRPVWWRRWFFPPFPNHHLRTNGFMMRRELMLRVWPRWTWTKRLCYLAESGRVGISRRVQRLGLTLAAIPTGLADNRNN